MVWQYGVTNEKGLGVNHLLDPFCARYSELDGGTVVIADTLDASRVIVVRYGDYVAGAPDSGFTEESIVWSYGTPGSAGSGPGQLDKPHGVDRLANGNILVADEDAQRVIEIDWETKDIPWQYGITDQAGDGRGSSRSPMRRAASATGTRSSPTPAMRACCGCRRTGRSTASTT